MTTNATVTATATVVCNVLPGHPEVRITATVPAPPDLAARIAARGLESTRDQVRKAIEGEASVKRWRTVQLQVAECNARIAEADKASEKAKALRKALEVEPIPDLANALRKAEAANEAASAARAQAQADLTLLQPLAAAKWVDAQQAAETAVQQIVKSHLLTLSAPVAAAEDRLRLACEKVAAILRDALEKHLAPAAAESLSVAGAAEDWRQPERFTAAQVESVLGKPPAGVVAKRNSAGRYEYTIAPAPEPRAAG
jgi:hypothetical protein